MRKILTQTDFDEMILQDKAVLSFYHDWSEYSAVYGIQYFKESDSFFRKQKPAQKIIFWLADVTNVNSPANFLGDWIKNNSLEINFFAWIAAGNPSVIWLKFGQILNCEFSAYTLRTQGIIEKTIKHFNL